MDEDGLHQLVSDRNQQLVIDFETLASMRYVSQHDLSRILTIIHARPGSAPGVEHSSPRRCRLVERTTTIVAMTTIQDKSSKYRTLLEQRPPFIPEPAEVMTGLVEVPPGGPGLPPHRHSGPVFGYVLEGEIIFELEGEPERVIKAGETFWEPGGDVIHYQDGNNLADAWSRFVVVMMCVPGQPMLTVVDADELESRRDRRAPRPR
jgi:quercetin dioxygenase-like cupin family protein